MEEGKKNVPTHGVLSSKRGRDKTADPSQPKVYFKKQTEYYCSLAALNNLHGYHAFTERGLKLIGNLLHSFTKEDLGVSEEFHEEQGDFSIKILKFLVKACKSDSYGWLSLDIIPPSARSKEVMMKKEKLLVHEAHDVDSPTKGHYYCYTQEHGKFILKDSEESKLKVIADMLMKVDLEKIVGNNKKYTVFSLTSNHPFDTEEEGKQNKLFS